MRMLYVNALRDAIRDNKHRLAQIFIRDYEMSVCEIKLAHFEALKPRAFPSFQKHK